MPNLTDSEKMEISKKYNEKWNEMKTAAKEKLPENLKEFIVDSIKSSSDRMKSDLYNKFLNGINDGTYKVPSDFFKAECKKFFNGVIYPGREQVFYHVIDNLHKWGYSDSYSRRSFRTAEWWKVCNNVMKFLGTLYQYDKIDANICDIIEEKNLTEEQLCHLEYTSYNHSRFMDSLLAAEIDMGNQRVINLVSDVIMCESEITMSHTIISAVTKCHNAELHEKLGKLLLAARLQEGLRQSICEAMDTGTKEAFLVLLDVIVDNNLIRFSSVKRAVGTWLGFIDEETPKLERISDKSVNLIYDCLHDEKTREEYLSSEDTMKIYVALWSIGFNETLDLLKKVEDYSLNGSRHQILVAGYVTTQLDSVYFSNIVAKKVIEKHKDDKEILAVYIENLMWNCTGCVSRKITNENNSEKVPYGSVRRYASLEMFFENSEEAEKIYGILMEIYKGMTKKSFDYFPCIFPWYGASLTCSDIIVRLAYIASALRNNDKIDEIAPIIPKIELGRNTMMTLLLTKPETAEQRRILTAEVCDKESWTRREAFALINQIELAEENISQLEDMLRYKNSDMRSNCIKLIMKQNDNGLFNSVSKLISDKKEEKRVAALDIIMQLSKDENKESLFEKCLPFVKLSETTSSAEKILIENILSMNKADETPVLYSDEDVYVPVIDKEFIKKGEQVFDKYFSKRMEFKPKWRKALIKLDELISSHADEEFVYAYNGESVTFGTTSNLVTIENGEHVIPFRKYWDKFYDEEVKSPVVLYSMLVSLCNEGNYDEYSQSCNKILKNIIGKQLTEQYDYEHFIRMYSICEYLFSKHCDREEIFYVSSAFINKLISMDSILIKAKINNGTEPVEKSLLSYYPVRILLKGLNYKGISNELRMKVFPIRYALEHRQDFCSSHIYGRAFHLNLSDYIKLDVIQYIHAAYYKVITETQMYREFFTVKIADYHKTPLLQNALSDVSFIYAGARELESPMATRGANWIRRRRLSVFREFIRSENLQELTEEQEKLVAFGGKIYNKLITTVLDKELKRGDLETEYSQSIAGINRIYGIDNFVKILCALGELPLERSIWRDKTTKKGALSHLLGVCVPDYEDNAEKLKEALTGTDITEKRLIEAAMYSAEWLDIVGEYLGWEGFTSACYYFIAHMNENFDDKRKAVIAKHTPLTPEELNAGSFDIEWFRNAYETLGQKRFDMIYDAAKYISDGTKHSRARKYADAALGKMNTTDTVKTIAEKRNKDLLMAYAIIPIENENDICARYLYLQQFLKESKKFGSQRSASEKKAVETAMQNLSINAGYADVTRLTLRMETKLIDDSQELFQEKEIESTVFRLCVDESGKTEIICTKNGKQLKSIPAKLKKNEYVVRLTETKKKLTEQYRRTKVMFEQAMEDSTEFTAGELNNLRSNPVVLPIIKNLVFVWGEKIGFLEGNNLVDYTGNSVNISDNEKVTIAHPYAIYKDGHWSEYQKYLFDNQLVQPFRQVFRELYVKTDEEAEMTHSLRYAGNQIQPAKTVACLKTRRWVADIEDGLQKIYYKENIVARIYAIADWFTPADIEAPTLEWVEFSDRKTGKAIVIKDVPDIIFSEVMRDVDLAVSVAHAGGVDPETSHSTVEMRAALIEFTLPLFKFTNVEIKGHHAHISGKYGEYTLNLGSGVIHKKGGTMINILPVHSQHRGKIFLPFADEDPKTAEIITKMLCLAEDNKIKDPTILEQIK